MVDAEFAMFFVSTNGTEIFIVSMQLIFPYVIAFGLLQVYVPNIWSLVFTFGVYILLLITCIGIGLMIAAVLSEKSASELPMLIIMPVVFLSGAIMPPR